MPTARDSRGRFTTTTVSSTGDTGYEIRYMTTSDYNRTSPSPYGGVETVVWNDDSPTVMVPDIDTSTLRPREPSDRFRPPDDNRTAITREYYDVMVRQHGNATIDRLFRLEDDSPNETADWYVPT